MARGTAEDRLKRILAMVPWVVAHDGPTVAETCARFRCTPEDLAADIELLYLCGLYPYTPDLLIEAAITDGRVFIQYADYFSRPLRLTAEEGLALVAAANTLLAAPGTEADGPLARGLEKLAGIIGGSAEAVDVDLGSVEQATLDELRRSVDAAEQVEIGYYAYGRDEHTTRTIEPAAVFSTGGQWYVSAYCHLAESERTFRVDRILSIRALVRGRTGQGASTTPELFRTRPVGGTVTIDLRPPARWVIDQYPIEQVEELADGVARVTLAVSEYAWLDRLVLRLGRDATVVSGPAEWHGPGSAARRVLARYAVAGHEA